MHFVFKILITFIVIIFASEIGKRYPHIGGLIATMPITTLLVLLWLNYDTNTNYFILTKFTKGVIFGIIPSIFFFIVLYFCFKNNISFYLSLLFAFIVWSVGALVHHYLLK